VVGLLLSGVAHHERQQIVRLQGTSFKHVFDRMKTWFQGNF
jgi:cell division protein FtsA